MARTVGSFGRWAGAIGTFALGLVAGGPSDHDGLAPARLLFLGAEDASVDRSFAAFQAAWKRVGTGSGRRVELRFVPVGQAQVADRVAHLAHAPGGEVDVVVAPTADTARAASAAGIGRAVVFASFADPVRMGLVASMQRPQWRVTGVSLYDDLHAKRIEILRDAYPRLRSLGILVDRSMIGFIDVDAELVDPARRLGFEPSVVVADDEAELRDRLGSSSTAALQAWYIPPSYVAYLAEAWLGAWLTAAGRPAMHATRREVALGALMSYEADASPAYEVMATMTKQILRGADAGRMPVWRPMRFTLSVRPQQALTGLRMQSTVIRRADHVY